MKKSSLKLPVIILIAFALLSSCGSPRTTISVSNKADGTDTKIYVTQGSGGSTSVNVIPSINASLDSITFKVK